MNKISEEINEILQEKGHVSIAELTNNYELPTEFIQQVRILSFNAKINIFHGIVHLFFKLITPRIGTIIKGNFDGNILYTHDYVNTQKVKLLGVLEASIKPIRFSQFIKEYGLDSGMIFGKNK